MGPMTHYLAGVVLLVLGVAACGGVVRRGDGDVDADATGASKGGMDSGSGTGDVWANAGASREESSEPQPPQGPAGELEIRMARPTLDVAIDSAHFVVKSFDERVLSEGTARVTDQGEQLRLLLTLAIVGGATIQFDTTGAGAGTCHGALGPFDVVEGQRATYLIRLLQCQPD